MEHLCEKSQGQSKLISPHFDCLFDSVLQLCSEVYSKYIEATIIRSSEIEKTTISYVNIAKTCPFVAPNLHQQMHVEEAFSPFCVCECVCECVCVCV